MNSHLHPSFTLSRDERLRGRSAVSQLFEGGNSGFVYPLRYLWRHKSEGDEGSVRVLFTVPKRFHKRANRRNLLRRRVKEAYRLHKSTLLPVSKGLDIALIYSTKDILEYSRIESSVVKILTQIASAEGVKLCAE